MRPFSSFSLLALYFVPLSQCINFDPTSEERNYLIGTYDGPDFDSVWANPDYNPPSVVSRAQNTISFPAFNYSVPIPSSPSTPINLFASYNWTLDMNMVTINRSEFEPGRWNVSTMQTMLFYDLVVPPSAPTIPLEAEANWTMCSSFLATPFSPSMRSRFSQDPGDCSVILGSDCRNAVLTAYTQQLGQVADPGDDPCRVGPFLSRISDICDDVGLLKDSGEYMIDYSLVNQTVTNPDSNKTYTLESGHQIVSQLSDVYEPGDKGQRLDEAWEFHGGMKMVVLTFQPSQRFLRENGNLEVLDYRKQVRLVCQAADPKVKAGEESQGDPSLNGVASLRSPAGIMNSGLGLLLLAFVSVMIL